MSSGSQEIMSGDYESDAIALFKDLIRDASGLSKSDKFAAAESTILARIQENEAVELEYGVLPVGALVLGFLIMTKGFELTEESKSQINKTLDINFSEDELSRYDDNPEMREERLFYLNDFKQKLESYKGESIEFLADFQNQPTVFIAEGQVDVMNLNKKGIKAISR